MISVELTFKIDVQVVTTIHIFVMTLLAMPHNPSDHAIATKVSSRTHATAARPWYHRIMQSCAYSWPVHFCTFLQWISCEYSCHCVLQHVYIAQTELHTLFGILGP